MGEISVTPAFVKELYHDLARKYQSHGTKIEQIWRTFDQNKREKAVRAGAAEGALLADPTDRALGNITRVLAEPALIQINRETGDAKDIVRAFQSLPLLQQTLYLELHGHACDAFKRAAEREMERKWQQIPELHRTVLSIYAANAFRGVFLLGSRFNHSCIPNVNFAYNPILEKETFHAIRDITAGEELTIMYIDGTNRTRSQRQAELDKWGFRCTCPACEDTLLGQERERKRAQLFAFDQELAMHTHFGTEQSHKKALQTAQRMAAIQKSEGLVNRELGVSYHDAAKLCLKLKNAKMAVLWAEKELEVDRYCIGEDHPDYRKELEMVDRLRAAAETLLPFDESITEWFGLDDPPADSCIIM
ncbi:hypothetical protein BBP40_000211 [Aspergillus hancockii]|nr:hypothetical protein BBP40_000211 [Aspergillus hancockii]